MMQTPRPEIQNSIHLEALRAVSQQRLEGAEEEVPPESAHGNRQALVVVRWAGASVSFDSFPREACNPESLNEQLNDMLGQLESTVSVGDDMTGRSAGHAV